MKKSKKVVSLLLTALMAITAFVGCGKEETDNGLTKVTLNEVAHSIFYAPMYVAIEEGYFEEEGIDITLVTGYGADKTMIALLSGEAEVGFMGSEASMDTYNEGANDYVVNFAQLTQRAGNFLVSREPMEDFNWDMLMGKKVLGGRAGGMPDGDYTLGGQRVHKEGIKCLMDDGTIAGSVLKLNEAVRNLYENSDLELYEAVKCASLYPAKALGDDREIGSLEVGKRADIIIADEKFNILTTVLGGEIRYKGE